jgi:predicted PurR-regulated permease PerM
VVWHLLVVTNIDNVLRPFLVPKTARLDPALMLLAVFAGISMFGFFGLVIGPVLMIIIVTTVSVYLAVYKGVELEEHRAEAPRKRLWSRFRTTATKTPPNESAPAAEPAMPPSDES